MGKPNRLVKRSKKMPPAERHIPYPPELPESRLYSLIEDVKDWQINHGSLVKLVRTDEDHTILSRLIGASLFPTPFPQQCFDEACELQSLYNQLYAAVAADEEWLEHALKDLLRHDRFTRILWGIHLEVRREGYIQNLDLGIFRSDYMLSNDTYRDDDNSRRTEHQTPSIKQVEFNAYSCAGGTHGSRISTMHQHLAATGVNTSTLISDAVLPQCRTIRGIVHGLSLAHRAYRPPQPSKRRIAVLMVVQPYNVNVADERPIEYALWALEEPVPMYRVVFGAELLSRIAIADHTRALLFETPNGEQVEISVVYQRAGYDEAEYNNDGITARLLLERSAAIKCPSVLSHITTFKKVQQALAAPNALERFLSEEDAERVRATFNPLYPMDDSDQGTEARKLATNPKTAVDYVLKPSLEGGGHNIYGGAIPGFLDGLPEELWSNFVLMKLIMPPALTNMLMSPQQLYSGFVKSELGIFGVCLWERRRGASVDAEYRVAINKQIGFSFKTKPETVNEMSVIKGYGCFDTPLLVDAETFQALTVP